jgi:hypothetical protein
MLGTQALGLGGGAFYSRSATGLALLDLRCEDNTAAAGGGGVVLWEGANSPITGPWCPPGTWASAAAVAPPSLSTPYSTASCTSCAVGTYQTGTGMLDAWSCVPCPAGRFSAVQGSAACAACPVGTYTEASGASACISCPPASGALLFPAVWPASCLPGPSEFELPSPGNASSMRGLSEPPAGAPPARCAAAEVVQRMSWRSQGPTQGGRANGTSPEERSSEALHGAGHANPISSGAGARRSGYRVRFYPCSNVGKNGESGRARDRSDGESEGMDTEAVTTFLAGVRGEEGSGPFSGVPRRLHRPPFARKFDLARTGSSVGLCGVPVGNYAAYGDCAASSYKALHIAAPPPPVFPGLTFSVTVLKVADHHLDHQFRPLLDQSFLIFDLFDLCLAAVRFFS